MSLINDVGLFSNDSKKKIRFYIIKLLDSYCIDAEKEYFTFSLWGTTFKNKKKGEVAHTNILHLLNEKATLLFTMCNFTFRKQCTYLRIVMVILALDLAQ